MRASTILWAVLAFACARADVASDNARLPDAAALRALLKSRENLTWVITGDSITHGAKHTNGARDYAGHFNERIRWELGRRDDAWINTGVSGEVTQGLLKAWDFRVARFRPAFVSVNLGMNDCVKSTRDVYRAHLVEIVRRTRALGAIPVLHVPNTVRDGDPRRDKLADFCLVVREVAAAEKALLVDHRAAWEKAAGAPGLARAEWLDDAIHPNGAGQLEMAKTLFRDLGLYDPASAVCRLGGKG